MNNNNHKVKFKESQMSPNSKWETAETITMNMRECVKNQKICLPLKKTDHSKE